MTEQLYREVDPLVPLNKAIEAAGGREAFFKAVGVKKGFLSMVLAGIKRPGPRIMNAIGVKRLYVMPVTDQDTSV